MYFKVSTETKKQKDFRIISKYRKNVNLKIKIKVRFFTYTQDISVFFL